MRKRWLCKVSVNFVVELMVVVVMAVVTDWKRLEEREEPLFLRKNTAAISFDH